MAQSMMALFVAERTPVNWRAGQRFLNQPLNNEPHRAKINHLKSNQDGNKLH